MSRPAIQAPICSAAPRPSPPATRPGARASSWSRSHSAKSSAAWICSARAQRQDVAGVAEPQLVEHVVELVAGQGADRRSGSGADSRASARRRRRAAPQLGAVAGQRDDVVGGFGAGRGGSGAVPCARSIYAAKLRRARCSSISRSATIAAHDLIAPGERVLSWRSRAAPTRWRCCTRCGSCAAAGAVAGGGGDRPWPARPRRRRSWQLVRGRAEAWSCLRTVLAVDVRPAPRRGASSLQDAARRARCAALEALAAARGRRAAWRWATRPTTRPRPCCSGSCAGPGSRGWRGIPYRRAPFIRPLLDVRAARGPALPPRGAAFRSLEDPSNADLAVRPRRVRHRLLPVLAEENPRVRRGAAGARPTAARGAATARRRTRVARVGRAGRRARWSSRACGARGQRRRRRAGRRGSRSAYGEVRIRAARRAATAAGAPAATVVHRRARRLPLAGGMAALRDRGLAQRRRRDRRAATRSTPIACAGRWRCGRAGPAIGCARAGAGQPKAVGPADRRQGAAPNARRAAGARDRRRHQSCSSPGCGPPELGRPTTSTPKAVSASLSLRIRAHRFPSPRSRRRNL